MIKLVIILNYSLLSDLRLFIPFSHANKLEVVIIIDYVTFNNFAVNKKIKKEIWDYFVLKLFQYLYFP